VAGAAGVVNALNNYTGTLRDEFAGVDVAELYADGRRA